MRGEGGVCIVKGGIEFDCGGGAGCVGVVGGVVLVSVDTQFIAPILSPLGNLVP